MAPAGCCGSRRRASSRERSRRIGPGGGWRPAVNGPGRLLRGLAGRMRSRCVPCTGACAPSPVPRLPSPAPRARARVHVLRVPRFASRARVFRVPCSVFRVPRPAPAPAAPLPCALCPWPRTRVSCAPCPCPRLLRSADGSPRSAPYLPPRTSGQVLPASASRRDEKKIGRFPTGTSRFCMHCSGARLTRACG